MNKHRLVILIIFVAILYSVNTLMVQAHEEDSSNSHVIHMTAQGFEPADITIIQGDIVIFENTDTRKRWPATNIHPTHSVYPDSDIAKCDTSEEGALFDACRSIDPGESYSFTFTKSGSWRFHDHIFPTQTGSITVERNPEFLEIENQEEQTQIDKVPWYSKLKTFFYKIILRIFPKILDKKIAQYNISLIANDDAELSAILSLVGPEKVMQKLLDETDGGSLIDCHQQAHQVGRNAYKLFGASVFEKGDASCHSGYYHGAMEGFLSDKGTENLADSIRELCGKFDTRFGRFECLHGVGHGVMVYEDYSLIDALETCEELDNDWVAGACSSGIFMENVITSQGFGAIPGHETSWVSNDPHFPCNAIGDSRARRFGCYQMQTSRMLDISGHDFEQAINWCLEAPPDVIGVCFGSIGRDAAGATLRDPQDTLTICSLVPQKDDYYTQCVLGGLNIIMDFWGPKLETQADEFCEFISEKDAQKTCFDVAKSRIDDLNSRE
jgi:plastocyanin